MRAVSGHSPSHQIHAAHGRRAFTLIEVLVVVSIIGVLIGLILPAVQAAREAARRMQCSANLKQIGIALHSYHATSRQFPPGSWLVDGLQCSEFSPYVALLPYLEQAPVFDAVNFAFFSTDGIATPSRENGTARRTVLSVLLCPSDSPPERRNNYRFNRGRMGMRGPRQPTFDGPFDLGPGNSDATVTDGLSRTAFVSERVSGNFIADSTDPKRGLAWPLAASNLPPCPNDDEYIPLCVAAPAKAWMTTSGRYWFYTGYANTHYNHNGSPNDPRPSCGDLPETRDWPPGLHPPRSFHPGGVNVLHGDGHVAFVVDGVDRRVWVSLGTHDSGD